MGSRDQILDTFGRQRQAGFPDRLYLRCERKERFRDPLHGISPRNWSNRVTINGDGEGWRGGGQVYGGKTEFILV